MAAWACCWACSSSPSELWRYWASRSAIRLKSRASGADLVLAAHLGARPPCPPRPAAARSAPAPRAGAASASVSIVDARGR